MVTELLIILGLILLNGFFSMSEIAIVSSKKARLEMISKKGGRGPQKALELMLTPNKFLSAVQIGITLIGILTGFFSGADISQALVAQIQHIPLLEPYAQVIGVGIVIFIVTLLSLIFGELVPKRIGLSDPERIASTVAVPIGALSTAARPIVWLLSVSTDFFLRLFNIRSDAQTVTEEEIRALIDEGTSMGTVEEIEQDIMENVFSLGDKRVESLMTHRSELVSFPVTVTYQEMVDQVFENKYSAYPVYDEDPDNIVGLISVKDLFLRRPRPEEFEIKEYIKPINFFPDHMKAYKALEQFKLTQIHHGIVVDEFGSTLGLITMTDILNELIGDLAEKGEDPISYELKQRDDKSWLVDGLYSFSDFLKYFDLEFPEADRGHYHTVGGFFIYQYRSIPSAGDSIEWQGFKFEVMDMDNRRVDKILITLDESSGPHGAD